MTIEELIERELKKAAKDSAHVIKKALKIGKEVASIFLDEFSKELLANEVEKRTGKKPKSKKEDDEEDDDES